MDFFIILFTIAFILVSFYYLFIRKNQFLLGFKIGSNSLFVNTFPFIQMNFTFDSIESINMIPYGESLLTTFRFNTGITNDVILIKRNRGFIREFVIGPDNVDQFYNDLKNAISNKRGLNV